MADLNPITRRFQGPISAGGLRSLRSALGPNLPFPGQGREGPEAAPSGRRAYGKRGAGVAPYLPFQYPSGWTLHVRIAPLQIFLLEGQPT